MPVQRILAFGDSNTWGFLPVNPAKGYLERLPYNERWTGVASHLLGADYEILEDALPGRTLAVDRPDMATGRAMVAADWNGLKALPATLVRNVPLDLVIIALGTNDLLMDPGLSADTYLQRLEALVSGVQAFRLPLPLLGMDKSPSVIVLAPPALGDITGDLPGPSNPGQIANRNRVALLPALKAHATANGYVLFDAADAVPTIGGDGVHLDASAHNRLGALVAASVQRMPA